MDTSETACRPAAGCCGHDVKFDGSTPAYRRVLVAVIVINLVGFVAVLAAVSRRGRPRSPPTPSTSSPTA